MLNDMLAKMASRMKVSESSAEMYDGEENPGKGSGDLFSLSDPEAKEKSSAIIAYAKPLLNKALRDKDPEAFDAWENKRKELLSVAIQHLRNNDYKKYQEAEKAVQKYQDETPMELYLTKDEIRGVLGDTYDAFQQAMKINNQLFAKRNVVGQKERESGDIKQMEDVAYGKRMMTQPSLSHGVSTTGFDFDPKTKSFIRRGGSQAGTTSK